MIEDMVSQEARRCAMRISTTAPPSDIFNEIERSIRRCIPVAPLVVDLSRKKISMGQSRSVAWAFGFVSGCLASMTGITIGVLIERFLLR